VNPSTRSINPKLIVNEAKATTRATPFSQVVRLMRAMTAILRFVRRRRARANRDITRCVSKLERNQS
jgi:hypothetical protein